MIVERFKRQTGSIANQSFVIAGVPGYRVVLTGFGFSVAQGTALTAATVEAAEGGGAWLVRKTVLPSTGVIADAQVISDGELGGWMSRMGNGVTITVTLLGSTGSPSYTVWANYYLEPTAV